MQETWVGSLGWGDPLEKGMCTHSSILARRIPMDRGAWWILGVGHSRVTNTHDQLLLDYPSLSFIRIIFVGHKCDYVSSLFQTLPNGMDNPSLVSQVGPADTNTNPWALCPMTALDSTPPSLHGLTLILRRLRWRCLSWRWEQGCPLGCPGNLCPSPRVMPAKATKTAATLLARSSLQLKAPVSYQGVDVRWECLPCSRALFHHAHCLKFPA